LQWKSQPSECNLWAGTIIEDKFFYAEIAGRSKYTRALNASDGSVLWEYENGGHSYAPATDLLERIVYCSVSGGLDEKTIFLHCLNNDTGEAVWKIKYAQYLFQPLIVGNHIYIGSRGHVALFSLNTGGLLATYQIEDGTAVTARPIKAESGVIFITEQGRIFCLNTVEAKKGLLRKKTTEFNQLWSLDLSSEVKARAVLAGSQLLVISEAGNLVKVNSENGAILSQDKLTGFKEGYGLATYENDLLISVSKDCARIANKI
jgi:outer membrane protein assembly factor BamB